MSRGFQKWTAEAAYDTKQKTAPKRPKETANQMTANIIRAICMQQGCTAYRINNVGIWDAAKGVYRKAHTQPGIFDISAIIRGKPVWIEVKAGRDKPSQEQLIFKHEIEQAGGVAVIIYSTKEFFTLFSNLLI